MQQFNLEEWLQDKSCKVVTRDGKDVRIICTDAKVDKRQEDYHVIALVDSGTAHGEDISYFNEQGVEFFKREYLFFADEKEELTEFEKAVQNILNEPHFQDVQAVKQFSKSLLDLARKELEKDIEHSAVEFAKFYMEDVNPSFEKVQESEELWKWKMSCLKGVNKAYTNGKQDALKDLADWKNRNSKGLWDAEKVCKFLYEKVIDITYFNKDNTNEHYDKDEFIDDLRKAMEADE